MPFQALLIKAETVSVNQLLELGNQLTEHEEVWNLARDKGLINLEGKDYQVGDKDVIEFKVNK